MPAPTRRGGAFQGGLGNVRVHVLWEIGNPPFVLREGMEKGDFCLAADGTFWYVENDTIERIDRLVFVPKIDWCGTWVDGKTYLIHDGVEALGDAYLCNQAHIADDTNAPPNEEYWDLLVAGGEPGPQGPAGEQGPIGEEGIQGYPGTKGDTGQQGSSGDQGQQGIQGIQGESGAKGDKGDTGSIGPQGVSGEDGEQGIQGIPGDDGAPGDQGPAGQQGPPGDDGAPGQQGIPGDVGPQGEEGEQGIQGVPGDTGPPGTTLHSGLTDVTADQHHSEAHTHTGVYDPAGTGHTEAGTHVAEHEGAANPHPTYTTDAEADAIADALIATHASDDDAHHAVFTPAQHTDIGDGSPHHAAVTIGADAEHSLAGQVLSGVDAAAAQKGHIQLAGQLGGSAAAPDVRGIRTTTGPTLLTVGAVADGEILKRSGATLIGATGVPGADPRLTTKVLIADQGDITGVTMVEITGLTVASLPIGTYVFRYFVIYQTTATSTGVEFEVDHASNSAFVSNAMFGTTGGSAATGIADQVGVGTAAGLMEVKTQRASNSRPGVTIGVDTQNANCLMVIEGVIVTTGIADLKLMMAAELASLVVRAKAGSALILTKVS